MVFSNSARLSLFALLSLSIAGCSASPQPLNPTVGSDRIVVDASGNEIPLPGSLSQPTFAGEDQDFGVPAQAELKQFPWLRNTPASHPSADVIYTSTALDTFKQGDALFVYVGDTLDPQGRTAVVPGSVWWAAAGVIDTSQTGSAEPISGEALQQRLLSELNTATGSDPTTRVVFYCDRPDCWLPYNAALRLAQTEYQNVAWYRGGTKAWFDAGLPIEIAAAPDWF